MDISIFPAPRKCHINDPSHDFSSRQWLEMAPTFSETLKQQLTRFAAEVGHHFVKTPQVSEGEKAHGKVLLRISHAAHLPAQGYSLKCTQDIIEIAAGDEPGAFYGLQTLKQILNQTGARIPAIDISDHPDFAQRGMMLDISRCKVPTMKSLEEYIDLLAALKFNQLQLYTEHTFAFSRHETVWFDASPITSEELLAIDRYCANNYIQLVPNFNSFGHFERWLRHPEYRHLAECPDGYEPPWGGRSPHGGVLYPDQRSLDFIDSLYTELLPNFTSTLFNIGADETWELGQGRSRERCEKEGTEKVYFDFLVQLAELVKKHHRQMMFWGDIILKKPELIDELPEDVIALDWGYEADHPFDEECEKFANAGVPFYVCPGTSSWNSLIGIWRKARKNLANAAENGLKHGASGYLITDWGDGGHHQYLPFSYPGILTGACFAWAFETNKDVDTARGLDLLIFKDRKAVLGRLLLDVSQVQNCIPKTVENATVFDKMLFVGRKELLETFNEIPEACFDEALTSFDRLKEQIADAQSHATDGALVEEEMAAGIEMAHFATLRAKSFIWPEQANETELKHQLEHIIRIHDELWLRRNRHGGLRESSDRLRGLFC